MKPFFLKADANNQPTSTPLAPDYVEGVVLVANAEATISVPAAAAGGFVIFSSDGPFWARPNATTAIPVANTSDGSGSVLSPGSWALDGVTAIHLISDSTTKLSLSFYKGKP